MTPKELAKKISGLMLDKKGTGILIMDLQELTPVTDYFVICSASSDTQVKAIADNIIKETKLLGEKPWHSEGYNNLNWVLLDYVNVVAHIFLEGTRRFYNLEGLWADGKVEYIDES
jgi:ribosome-associated protein